MGNVRNRYDGIHFGTRQETAQLGGSLPVVPIGRIASRLGRK
jgi:hypothetical protein